MVRIITSFTLLLAAAATMVSAAPAPAPAPVPSRWYARIVPAAGPDTSTDRDDRFIAQEKEKAFIAEDRAFAEREMDEAEEAYKLAKALYQQRMDAAENDGQIQFTQFSEVS